jgi:hypothetical protein
MMATTLEFEPTSTLPLPWDGDQWMSTSGEPEESGFAPLSEFDRVIHIELSRLAALQANWDAEGARRIDRRLIAAARNFVSALPGRIKAEIAIPAVVPLRKGNLQFEWHDGRRTLELELETATQVHYLKWHPEAGVEEEDMLPVSNVQAFADLLMWFMKG